MKYLHTMVRVTDLDASLRFYCDGLGLRVLRRQDMPQGRFTLVFLAAPGDEQAQVELTYNWDPEHYGGGRNFGHLAYAVEDIYASCERLRAQGVAILRPPRDGYMAFVRSPDGISIDENIPMATAKAITREAMRSTRSAREINRAIHKPLAPSAINMPSMKTRPSAGAGFQGVMLSPCRG